LPVAWVANVEPGSFLRFAISKCGFNECCKAFRLGYAGIHPAIAIATHGNDIGSNRNAQFRRRLEAARQAIGSNGGLIVGRKRTCSDETLRRIVAERARGKGFDEIGRMIGFPRKVAYNHYYKWLTRKMITGDGFGSRTTIQ
tara:strand:- start:190 stop:615 length:426 start_codon:yes stop_codon:yes gene_type:complete